MKNIGIVVGVLLIVFGIGFVFKSKQKPQVLGQTTFVPNKTFDVKGLNYAYDVKEIRVKLNDKVKINFTNTEGMHNFIIDELGVKTNVIKAGETESVEFAADKTGTFQYYCSVGQHRQNGMWGNLIVE